MKFRSILYICFSVFLFACGSNKNVTTKSKNEEVVQEEPKPEKLSHENEKEITKKQVKNNPK